MPGKQEEQKKRSKSVDNRYGREALLIGDAGVEKLRKCRVAVFGLGGVGSYVAEALARSGVGTLDFIDGDVVSFTNLNRQLVALESTVGREKTQVAAERVKDIDPSTVVHTYPIFYGEETKDQLDFSQFDYVVDAIDTVTSKLLLIEQAVQTGVPVVTCMGTGNKLDPTQFRVTPIEKTSVCPLARVMRRELKKRGISGVKALWSPEEPLVPLPAKDGDSKGTAGRPVPGSMAFVPSVAGLILAGEVVKDLLGGWPRIKE